MALLPVQTAGGSFTRGAPVRLLDTSYARAPQPYDIAPDGQRFLMIKDSETRAQAAPKLVFVVNWFEELKANVSTGK